MAASLAAEIKDKLGIPAKLKKGHGGIFEVTMGDNIVYTKCACRAAPSAAEIIERINMLRTGQVANTAESRDQDDSCCDPSGRSSCCC